MPSLLCWRLQSDTRGSLTLAARCSHPGALQKDFLCVFSSLILTRILQNRYCYCSHLEDVETEAQLGESLAQGYLASQK